MWLMSVIEKMSQKIFCQKRLFSEFGPLEFGLEYEKFEIAEDIHTNCVIHFEKLVVLLKDFHMKFISNTKVYFIKALWRHNESLKFKNILSFQRLPKAQKSIFLPKTFLETEKWKVIKPSIEKIRFSKFYSGPILGPKNWKFVRFWPT